MDKSKIAARIKYFGAVGGLIAALAGASPGLAQQFDVPEGFVIVPGADTARSED